jgi:hypothetical protein
MNSRTSSGTPNQATAIRIAAANDPRRASGTNAAITANTAAMNRKFRNAHNGPYVHAGIHQLSGK